MPRIPFVFPEKGKNDNVNFPTQPPDSSSDLSNVRVFDSIASRRRGGSRPGLSKWFSSLLSGANRIQYLLKAVEAQAIGTGTGGAAAAYSVSCTATTPDSRTYFTADKNYELLNSGTRNSTGVWLVKDPLTGDDYGGGEDGATLDAFRTTSAGVGQWDVNRGLSFAQTAFDEVNSIFACGIGANNVSGLAKADGTVTWSFGLGAPIQDIYAYGGYFYVVCKSNQAFDGAAGADKSVFKLDGSDGTITASFNVVIGVGDGNLSVNKSNGHIYVHSHVAAQGWDGWVAEAAANLFEFDGDLALLNQNDVGVPDESFIIMSMTQDADDNCYLLSDRGYLAKILGTNLSVVYEIDVGQSYVMGDGTPVEARDIDYDFDRSELVICGNLTSTWYGGLVSSEANAAAVRPADGVVTRTITFTSGGSSPYTAATYYHISVLPNQGDVRTRQTSLVAVVDGDVVLVQNGGEVTITNGASALVTTLFAVQADTAFSIVYFVDGTNEKKLTLSTSTVATWAPGDSFPTNPRLIARWRGRVCLAGMISDPHNWVMSRVGDAEDFDTAPATTDAIMAVAGNISEYGLAGDLITGLCPFDDDVMIVGMDSSIGKFAGDPAAGGVIDVVTEKTGMAWNAWTMGSDNQLYFMGNDGIYMMGRDTDPVNITEGILDGAFENVDLTTKRVQLEWDFRNRGLVVVIADTSSSTVNEAYFMEARTGGWFPVAWPAAMGPDVLAHYDGEETNDRSLLLGCRDGYIRQPDLTATDDDGTSITSNVRLFPIGTRRGTDTRLMGLEVNLAESSGDVTLKLYTGQTAEQCATSTDVRWSRVLKAGKNNLTLPRLRGAWLQIEFAATSRWALESVFGLFEEGGRARRLKR